MKSALVLVLVASGCGAATSRERGEDLVTDLRVFHEGLRWRRYDEAADHVPPAARTRFLDVHEELDSDLRIDDYDIVRVSWSGTRAAKVRVRCTWHLDSVGVVHETTVDQSWERQGKVWRIVASEHHKGETLPADTLSVELASREAARLP
jgi:hypothetical protein